MQSREERQRQRQNRSRQILKTNHGLHLARPEYSTAAHAATWCARRLRSTSTRSSVWGQLMTAAGRRAPSLKGFEMLDTTRLGRRMRGGMGWTCKGKRETRIGQAVGGLEERLGGVCFVCVSGVQRGREDERG
jgi:hypothetical protein